MPSPACKKKHPGGMDVAGKGSDGGGPVAFPSPVGSLGGPESNLALPPTSDIYTLSLHDALPISTGWRPGRSSLADTTSRRETSGISESNLSRRTTSPLRSAGRTRSEEHTSELQSQSNLVCRLLLAKKNIRGEWMWRGRVQMGVGPSPSPLPLGALGAQSLT